MKSASQKIIDAVARGSMLFAMSAYRTSGREAELSNPATVAMILSALQDAYLALQGQFADEYRALSGNSALAGSDWTAELLRAQSAAVAMTALRKLGVIQ